MPRQDAMGRWVSDDGIFYWDGAAWRPIGAQPTRGGGMSALPAIAIGCGFVIVLAIVLMVGFTVLLFNNSDMQRSFCQGYTNGDANATCPFRPSP